MFVTAYTATYPDLCQLIEDDEQGGLRFEIDRRRISIRLTAPYSEERRQSAHTVAKRQRMQLSYILPFSHDEVVHGKKTIIDKLNGSYESKFAQARLLYLYMMTHPGKKLNFMGNELAMFREWDERREPDWDLLKMPAHDSFHRYMGELNRLYLKKKAIWGLDHTYDGFKWVDCKSNNKCVFGYTRTDGKEMILALFNFSDKDVSIAPEVKGKVTMLLNTDWEPFGGSMKKLPIYSIPNYIPPYCGYLLQFGVQKQSCTAHNTTSARKTTTNKTK